VTDYIVNPSNWYSNRELPYTPKHFTVSNTPLTQESRIWIMNSLVGRYSIVQYTDPDNTDDSFSVFSGLSSVDLGFGRPAFEDPKEAVFYELTWS